MWKEDLSSLYTRLGSQMIPSLQAESYKMLSWVSFGWIIILQSAWLQDLYSLSGKTSNRKISWSLEVARYGFRLFQSYWIWQAPRQQCYRDACQISERYDHCNIKPRGFETSRDLTVRCPSAWWIEAHLSVHVWTLNATTDAITDWTYQMHVQNGRSLCHA